jgi:hypothetical protein
MSLRVAGVLAITIYCVHASGQYVISAKAGLINHVEGQVLLSGEPVVSKSGARRAMQDGSELRAQEGRAEVLLNPGGFLRVGENSAVRMLSNQLADTRIEFVSGAALIEPGGRWMGKEDWASPVSIAYQGTIVHLLKNGVYRFDTEPAQLRVYAGEASVTFGAGAQVVGAGETIALANPGPVQEFDRSTIDALGLWSRSRAAYISKIQRSSVKRKKDKPLGGVWPRQHVSLYSRP